MPKPTKRTITRRAKNAVAFGHICEKGKRGNKVYRINADMCYNLCLQIIGNDAFFDGPARDLILKAFEIRDAEVNPENK